MAGERRPGAMRGRIWMAEDVHGTPEDLIAAMEGAEDDLSGVSRVEVARTGEGPMSDDTPTKEPRIPRPPTREELDEISEAQGMITDEWAPVPRDSEKPKG